MIDFQTFVGFRDFVFLWQFSFFIFEMDSNIKL